METRCPYCGTVASLVTGDDIYPHRHDLSHKKFYRCAPCDAYVGCHAGTAIPLGRLANASLRRAKVAAHAAFDPLWKSGKMKRRHAYDWLATQLGILVDKTHIGEFDERTCLLVVDACKRFVKGESHANDIAGCQGALREKLSSRR